MKIIRIVIFWILCICHHALPAQTREINFNHLTVEDGLSQSTVLAIFQDSRGYMWFGTQDGLNRYNSVDFETYRHQQGDSLSLPGNAVIEIYEDSKGNIWAGTYSGLAKYLPELNLFKAIPLEAPGNYSDANFEVSSILEDKNGALWIGAYNGLYRSTNANPSTPGDFKLVEESRLPGTTIFDLFLDDKGAIWVGTSRGLCQMRPKKSGDFEFTNYYTTSKPALSSNEITIITQDKSGNIWIGTRNGLNKLSPDNREIEKFTNKNSGLINNFIRDIVVDPDNNLWIGTYRGLSFYHRKSGAFYNYTYDPHNPNSLSDNSIHSIFQDNKGSVWVGTYFNGVNLIDIDNNRFKNLKHSHYENSLSSNIISSMTEDKKGNIFIGTEGRGLNYYDRNEDRFYHYTHRSFKNIGANIKSLFIDHEDNLWIGTYQEGLCRLQAGKNNFERQFSQPENVFSIVEDHNNELWIGTYGSGLWKRNTATGEFTRYDDPSGRSKSLSSNLVRIVFEDSRNNLWVGTQYGLNVQFNGAHTFKKFIADPENDKSLKDNTIYAIYEDSRQRLWIGTYGGGLSQYNYKNENFTSYTKDDGLSGNNIFGILEDNRENLWLSTNNGITKFNPVTGYAMRFGIEDGLPGNEFNFNSHLKVRSGEMFFGSKKGLTHFFPSDIKESKFKAPIVFTELKLFNKPVAIGGKDGLLQKDISLTSNIVFNHKQNVFTIDFALLNFLHPQKNSYAYKLVGFEDDWNFVDNPSATYTNLSPGHYKLLVKASNNDSVWNSRPASMNIEVLPPPWKTWWAYLFYAMACIGALVLFTKIIKVQAKLKHDLQLEHLEKEKEKEVHQLKLQFFTNISHEIRTPLTLILGPLQNLTEKYANDNMLQRQLNAIKSNTNRMLWLVNQIMDLRKLETKNAGLKAAEGNIVKFVKEIKLSFQETARLRNIDYQFSAVADDIRIWYDRDELEKALYNLLSNAFKFTTDGGKICIDICFSEPPSPEKYVVIKVKDNGRGIPEKDIGKIFNRFYQANQQAHQNGSGIGLALAKGIIDLHRGKIKVKSRERTATEPGKTAFAIWLPMGSEHLHENEIMQDFRDSEQLISYIEQSSLNHIDVSMPKKNPATSTRETLLIVEDNLQIRRFIKETLSEKYIILEALNGKEGWEIVTKKLPDLIISDVVMPEMDGIEFCRKIKTDERTSHIPVILLTARTSLIHKEAGYETGADEYVTKPFNVKLLEIRIKNLIQSRLQLRKKFSNKAFIDPSSVVASSTDEKFLKKLIATVEANLHKEEFNVSMLTLEIGMSQPVLFRKIKALTDMNINDFIKSVRLKKAAVLLMEDELSIAEVASEVGYNNPKYFSKIFKEYFGKSPSNYACSR